MVFRATLCAFVLAVALIASPFAAQRPIEIVANLVSIDFSLCGGVAFVCLGACGWRGVA